MQVHNRFSSSILPSLLCTIPTKLCYISIYKRARTNHMLRCCGLSFGAAEDERARALGIANNDVDAMMMIKRLMMIIIILNRYITCEEHARAKHSTFLYIDNLLYLLGVHFLVKWWEILKFIRAHYRWSKKKNVICHIVVRALFTEMIGGVCVFMNIGFLCLTLYTSYI